MIIINLPLIVTNYSLALKLKFTPRDFNGSITCEGIIISLRSSFSSYACYWDFSELSKSQNIELGNNGQGGGEWDTGDNSVLTIYQPSPILLF